MSFYWEDEKDLIDLTPFKFSPILEDKDDEIFVFSKEDCDAFCDSFEKLPNQDKELSMFHYHAELASSKGNEEKGYINKYYIRDIGINKLISEKTRKLLIAKNLIKISGSKIP